MKKTDPLLCLGEGCCCFSCRRNYGIEKVVSASNLMLSASHDGILRNGADFIAPQNIPVLTAAAGTVTYVKDDSNAGAQIHHHIKTMVILTSVPQ